MRLYEFPRSVRLLTPKDFRKVFDQVDVKVSCAEFTLLATFNKSTQSRIGFIVAKKQIKTAVQRNRVKRHFREQYRHQKINDHFIDCIILVRNPCQNLDNSQLNQAINKQFKRLQKRIIKNTKSQN